ncbi:hypothetical protein PF005_g27297 [Phytophthora fragariae]|uniref:Uncharacterized protein n=1 Tax=Phytophthora fragariae TaxID=53985 RepID=A0A6A4BNT1_9STRA|nr:hypothetical protein PF003_g34905 [Phytophthora fragariae]KAE8921999.1 hypothetical protein PF009_g27729 [Phytophthora fragariae]KAE8970963.1 hypothetical protein PF011_g26213 [Phytophthora fragariae]KAE9069375.1 hypothetical protein PF010_g26684 [Phytophthora fragariae]KAE9070225.1 hypothetical protein PF007_g27020 [Phytophthora fragariae]
MGNISSCYKTKKQGGNKTPLNNEDDASNKSYEATIDAPRAAENTKERAPVQSHQAAAEDSPPLTPEFGN